MDESGVAPPVFVGAIGIEDLRGHAKRIALREQAVGEAGFRVGLRKISEWKKICRIERIEKRMAIAGRLCKAVVETAATPAADVGPDTIEDLAAFLILVETEVEERAQEAAALRNAEADGALDVLRLVT